MGDNYNDHLPVKYGQYMRSPLEYLNWLKFWLLSESLLVKIVENEILRLVKGLPAILSSSFEE